jgi:phage tail sheath gpL-like
MAISFNQIPNNIRVPFVYVEFDNSNAIQGANQQVYRALIIGQKTSAGTATADVPVSVTSAAQAKTLFGAGSMLAHMFEKWFKNNSSTAVFGLPLADNGAGVQAAATVTFTGPASAAGTVSLYIAGRVVQAAVLASDSVTVIAAALASAINANTDLPVTATSAVGVTTITNKHKGAVGNEVDIRLNYYDGEALPAGVGATIAAFSAGATNPVLTTAISNMGDEQYNIIAFPYSDASSLTALEAELADRFGPIRQIEGMAFVGKNADHSTLLSLGDSRNSPHVSICSSYKEPTTPYEKASALAGVVAVQGAIDPARPLQTLPLAGILPPAQTDRFTWSERNLLLYDGISTTVVDSGGLVRIERLITTYQENPAAAPDPSYLDVETLLTLSYLRFDFRTYFLLKYPRHKLANDGTRFGAGQAVITPKIGKAEAIAKFRQWEEQGLVEGIDQFKNDLIVERNISDVNRLDFMLPPDLINQLRVTGVKIGFLL